MLKDILEKNRRSREYDNISGKCIKYSYKPKLFAYDVFINSEGLDMSVTDRNLRGNMYVWYEVYYNTSYILIKESSTGNIYYLYPKKIPMHYLTMIVHDLIASGSNLMFILETDDSNKDMKKLLTKLRPKFGLLLQSNDIFQITQVPSIPMNYSKKITYNIPSNVTLYRFNVDNGEYNFRNILLVPSIGRIYKIISKYVDGI